MSIEKILQPFATAYGVCGFAALQQRLRACRAMARVPKNAKSVILFLFPYRFPDDEKRELSRYACVNDYHVAVQGVLDTMVNALKAAYPQNDFAAFTDNSPIPEVYAAAKAGLGIIGDNGLLIHRRYGSFVFIGEIVTDLSLPVTDREIAYCEHCGACAAACPGGCLPQGDRALCVSAISQKKGELSEQEIALLQKGGLIWGCDRCSEVCPHNTNTVIAPHPCFNSYIPYLLDANHPLFDSRAYAWRGKAVPMRNKTLLQK